MTDTETCHVVVLGFDPQLEPPVARLQRVFGLDAATCAALLENLPSTVQRAVPRVRAEYFRRALLSIGAHVEVRSAEGELIPPPAKAPVAPPSPGPAAEDPAPTDTRAARLALHAAPTEPLPPLQPAPWAAEPSPWAVDATSRTLAQGPVAPETPATADTAPGAWAAAAPWISSTAPPSAPTAFGVLGAAAPEPPAPQPAPAWAPPAPTPARSEPTAWSAPAAAVPQPELRAPAAPTLREAAAAPQALATPFGAGPAAAARAAPFAAAPFAAAPAPFAAAPAPFAAAPAPFAAAPGAWGGALDLASIPAPPRAQESPRPFALGAGAAPVPVPTGAVASRMPSDIWDIPAGEPAPSRQPFARDPSGVYDPPGAARPSASAPATPRAATPRASTPPASAARPSARAAPFHSSAPPPPSALEHALRSLPPPATQAAPAASPRGAADAQPAGFQVLHKWEQLRAEFPPGASGPAPRPSDAPPNVAPRARPAPHAAGSAAAPRTAADSANARTAHGAGPRTFWDTFGEALALPFTGPGPYWIAAITVWSVAVGALGLLAGFMFLASLVVSFCGQTALLAMACDYARVCFWTPAVGEHVLDRGPDFDPMRLLGSYLGRGLHLSCFMLLSQVASIAWVLMSVFDGSSPEDLLLDPVSWLLFFLPYFYWPMGVALTALRNDFGAIWLALVGLRAIVRAPLEYLAIVLTGFTVLASSALALFLLGSALGLSGTLLSGIVGLPLALSHGIQGALMGHLMRARAEIFE